MKIKWLVASVGAATILFSSQCYSNQTKPTKNGLSGTNNAWAMSEPTVQSIYLNLAKQAGVEPKTSGLNSEACVRVKNRLAEVFNQQEIVCKLTLKPNGRIVDLVISKSSGSEDSDKKALELIRMAGPFKSNKFPEPLSYEVQLPAFKVKPQLL